LYHPEISSGHSVGRVIRVRSIPFVLGVPLTLSWLIFWGHQNSFYDFQTGLIILTVMSIFVLGVFVWFTGRSIDRVDAERIRVYQQFRDVVELAPVAMIKTDDQGVIVLVNRKAEEIFDYSRDELIGRPIEVLMPDRFRARHVGNRADFMRHLETRSMGVGRSLFGLRKDGTEFPVEIGLNPIIRNEKVRVLCMIVDITERKRIEDQVRESESKLRMLADSMPQIVWTAGSDGQADYFNKRWFEYTGLSLEDHNSTWLTILHPDDHKNTVVAWEEALRTGENFKIEYRLKERDSGKFHWFLGRAHPVKGADGKVERWFGTCTDIEELKQANDKINRFNIELEQKVSERTSELRSAVAALEASNKELDSFSYSISHDLRTPLRAIDGFSRILMEDYRAELSDGAQGLFERIRNNVKRMSELIDDLLTFSRIGRVAIEDGRTANTQQIVLQTLSELKETLGQREIEIRQESLPPCNGDPVLLKQVWSNLLSNALKYSSKKDHSIIEIGTRPDLSNGEVVYFVKDNGVGFDMKYADKLFGVFQRLHGDGDFEGTGVGLAIAQRIVLRHGGRLWAEAEVGKGATFFVALREGSSYGN